MTKREESRQRQWDKLEKQGAFRFILIRGSFWGLMMGAVFSLTLRTWHFHSWALFMLIWWIGGLIWGAITWLLSWYGYKKERTRKQAISN
jgi:hypothetical protein